MNSGDEHGRTPLSLTAENGHEVGAELLLAQGIEADWRATGDVDQGTTPLSFAAESRSEAIVKLLLAHQVEADSKPTSLFCAGQTPLSFAASEEIVVKLLQAHGAEVDLNDTWGRTLLSYAVKQGHEAMVELLLKYGAKADPERAIGGRTPLSFAAQHGHEAIAKLILAHEATVDGRSEATRSFSKCNAL
ncbi:ankyrin repeat-containing protein [Dactylonectria estremocensis]|uniref:Ankyrin repeat-containing protein n=1 Tax=Dactylonectria estremocensis TaxID=1079267 RepID=A0A9P9E2K5_9HYPO|nr:ankyrin repeat-containing protein [Dactylonectria estremocensis]